MAPSYKYQKGNRKPMAIKNGDYKIRCSFCGKTEDQVRKLIAVEEPGDVPQVLYRVARAYFDFAGSHWQFYLFMLSQFYSGKKSEGFRTVYPLIQKYYQLVVRIFEVSNSTR